MGADFEGPIAATTMTETYSQTATRVVSLLMALLMVGSMMAAAGPGLVAANDPVTEDDIEMQDADGVEIDSELNAAADERETVEVYVRLDAATATTGETVDERSEAALKHEAETAQESLHAFAEVNENVELAAEFWLDNAALVEIDTRNVEITDLARIDGVVELHPNYEVEHIEPDVTPGDEIDDDEPYTYGVDQVNAPEFWEAFDNKGENASIAIVDTGINPDHEAFPDYDEDNWAQFDFDGSEIDSEPFDQNSHGTHVAGTAAGSDASGTAIGVAPDAELYAINVFPDPGGATTLAAIVAGMEHAVEEDIDVANFSLGGGGFAAIYVDIVENALDAGTLFVSSSGNDGPGSTGTPGNVYDSVSVGATDVDEAVTGFSTGAEVDTGNDWGAVAPSDWPDEYTTPDVTAPGANVLSADLEAGQPVNDAYGTKSGTSMSAPHVTGIVALLASEFDTDPETTSDVLETTAQKPAPDEIGAGVVADAGDVGAQQVENLHFDDVSDVRYGVGIVDAYAAGAYLADERTISGSVVDSEGNDVTDATGVTSSDQADITAGQLPDGSGASVTSDRVSQSEYAIDGSFAFDVTPDTYDVNVTGAFGYEDTSVTLDATDDDVTDEAIELDEQFAVQLAADQPSEVEAGNEVIVGVDIAHVENLTVALSGDSTVNASNVSVALGGNEIPLNESVAAPDGVITGAALTVSVDESVADGETIELVHTFEGASEDEVVTVSTGPTTVVDEITETPELTFSETDIADEALASEPVAPGSLTILNPADETQVATVVWETPLGDLAFDPIELEPGEEETLEPALSQPPSWAAFGGPGDAVPYSFALYDGDFTLTEREDFVTELVGFEITGTVTDADTGEPVPGVPVTATDGVATIDTVTDSDGEYTMVADAPGEWTVNAQNDGFGPTAEEVTITEDDETIEQNLTIGSTATFSFDLEAGDAATIGIPGPVAGGTVGDVIDTDAQAVVFAYDNAANDWQQVSGDDPVDPLEALVIVPSEDTEATLTIDGEPGDTSTGQPDATELADGWNFVSPSVYGDTSEAFQLTTSEIGGVLQVQDQADSQTAPAGSFEGLELTAAGATESTPETAMPSSDSTLSPFAGYFVFATEAGELGSVLTEGETRMSTYDRLGVDATTTTGTITSAVDGEPISGATVTVDDANVAVQTAADGSFVLPSLPDDIDQTVTVDAPGFESAGADLTDTTDVELQDESYYQVNDLSVPDEELSVGDSYEIEYNVSNEGVDSDQQIVEVIIGEDLDSESSARMGDEASAINSTFVRLDAGESVERTIESEIIAAQPSGDVQIGVYTNNDEAIAEVTITEESSSASLDAAPLQLAADAPSVDAGAGVAGTA